MSEDTLTLGQFQDEFARALIAEQAQGGALAGLYEQPGFSVYRNTVLKSCIDTLAANFPSILTLVGAEWFHAAAAIYARAHLPKHSVLLDYGDNFASFLQGFAPAQEIPYLADVARADRFWSEAHVAADAATAPADCLAHLSSEQLMATRLRPLPSARWRWFEHHPVASLWFSNSGREPKLNQDSEASADSNAAQIAWRAEGLLIVRPHDAVIGVELSEADCALLDACAAGESLENAALRALTADPAADLGQSLSRLLRATVFCQIDPIENERSELSARH